MTNPHIETLVNFLRDSAMRVAEDRGWILTEEDSDAEESH